MTIVSLHQQKEETDNGRKGYVTQDDRKVECLYCLISATNRKQAEQNARLQERIKELTAQVAWLNRQLFGRKSGKLPVYDPNMPDLFAEEFAEEFAEVRLQAEEKRDGAVEKIEKESAVDKKQKR